MLYCYKCKIDYSDGKKFCKTCGQQLEPKPSPPIDVSQQQPSPQIAVSGTAMRYCPTCNAEYESDKKFCKTCGTPLLTDSSQGGPKLVSSPQNTPQAPQKIEAAQQGVIEKTSSLPKSRVKWFLRRLRKLNKKGQKLSTLINNLEKQRGIISEDALSITLQPYKTQYDGVKNEMKEIESSFKTLRKELTDDISQKQKEVAPHMSRVTELKTIRKAKGLTFMDYRRFRKEPACTMKRLNKDIRRKQKILKLVLPPSADKLENARLWVKLASGVVIIALLGGGGFLSYKYFFSKKDGNVVAGTEESSTGKEGSISTSDASPKESIERVFDTIRKANINKDINLYASCFSPAFPSIEERKSKTESNWKDYDFTDLNFTVKNLVINQSQADVVVDWQINARAIASGQNEIFNTTNYVVLVKDSGQWKIASLK